MFISVHTVSWGSRWVVYEPLARWHMQVKKECADTRQKVENFSQSVNAASFHILSSIFAWRILRRKQWLFSVEDWGDIESLDYIDLDFKFYYLLYAARYISDMVSLKYEHTRSVRKMCSILRHSTSLTEYFTRLLLLGYLCLRCSPCSYYFLGSLISPSRGDSHWRGHYVL
jgi:hypothetical protein